MSHRFNNGEKFVIMNVLIALCRGTLMRVEGNQVPMEIMERVYDARYCKFRGVDMQANGKIMIKMFENGGCREATVEFIKCKLSLVGPMEPLALSE